MTSNGSRDDSGQPFDLPDTFDEWPVEDQKEYLEHTKAKRELIRAVFYEAGLDNEPGGKTNPSLAKLDWVELLLALRELRGALAGGDRP